MMQLLPTYIYNFFFFRFVIVIVLLLLLLLFLYPCSVPWTCCLYLFPTFSLRLCSCSDCCTGWLCHIFPSVQIHECLSTFGGDAWCLELQRTTSCGENAESIGTSAKVRGKATPHLRLHLSTTYCHIARNDSVSLRNKVCWRAPHKHRRSSKLSNMHR